MLLKILCGAAQIKVAFNGCASRAYHCIADRGDRRSQSRVGRLAGCLEAPRRSTYRRRHLRVLRGASFGPGFGLRGEGVERRALTSQLFRATRASFSRGGAGIPARLSPDLRPTFVGVSIF